MRLHDAVRQSRRPPEPCLTGRVCQRLLCQQAWRAPEAGTRPLPQTRMTRAWKDPAPSRAAQAAQRRGTERAAAGKQLCMRLCPMPHGNPHLRPRGWARRSAPGWARGRQGPSESWQRARRKVQGRASRRPGSAGCGEMCQPTTQLSRQNQPQGEVARSPPDPTSGREVARRRQGQQGTLPTRGGLRLRQRRGSRQSGAAPRKRAEAATAPPQRQTGRTNAVPQGGSAGWL